MARIKYPFLAESYAKSPVNLKLGPGALGLGSISLRESSSRALDAAHIVSLAESISELGLLEPLIVDNTGRLLAGNHRLAALQILAIVPPEQRKERFAQRLGSKAISSDKLGEWLKRIGGLSHSKVNDYAIPVQVIALPRDNAEKRALAIEAAENHVRMQYSKSELQALAKRFRDAGYVETKGRPKGGQKTVMCALEAALGLSKRQIQRLLSDGQSTSEPKTPLEKTQKAIEKVVKHIDEIGSDEKTDEAKALIKKAEAILTRSSGGTTCKSRGMQVELSRRSPKIQDSLADIDKAILPRLKLMRAQCEKQAAKEFPVDTPDYFTVVDHITKRLLPLITRLEAEIVTA